MMKGDPTPALGTTGRLPGRPRAEASHRLLLTAVLPVTLTLVLSGLLLLAFGADPIAYYGYVLRRGLLSWLGFEATATRMAPLLFLAASLIVAFRAGIWNLGVDGQLLLAAVAAAAAAPVLVQSLPAWATLVLCFGLAALVATLWSIVPALLKAYQGINEIITTLMMSFLGLSVANLLVKLAFFDPATTVPQTRTLAVADRLPRLFDTTISSGLVFGIIAVVAVHLMMTRTAFGLRLRLLGASQRAAVHAGLHVPQLTLAVFAISAALAGLAGAVEVLGVQGNVRADWNPAYGLAVIPLVFLARFNGFAAIAFVFLFSVLSVGAESASRRLGVPHFFTLVVMAVLLVLLALADYLDARWQERAGAGGRE